MEEVTYRIMDWAGNIEAEHMNLTTALILLEGLYERYYLEPTLTFQIQREVKTNE